MSVRQTSSSPAHPIQRAAVACSSCRLRKVKCDAQSSLSEKGCGPCRRLGQKCLIDPMIDGRKRGVSRKVVDKLRQRIQYLESLNHESGAQSERQCNEVQNSTSSGDVADFEATTNDGTTFEPANSSIHCIPLQDSHMPDQMRSNSPGKSPGGSPSFYGATSHPHVTSPREDLNSGPFDDESIPGIDLDPSSLQLQVHLLQAFFRYQTLWVDIVNKDTFEMHKSKGQQSRWYSKFLEHTMLACGARLSTSKAVRALGLTYRDWAKTEVVNAMYDPTPANLQGFLLLSEYEVTHGNDRPGWLFCGVACRMLSDLGLHEFENASSVAQELQQLTNETDRAYALLSACIVYEGVWTLYLGRPSSIPETIMNAAASRCREKRPSDSLWLNAWLGLCMPMAAISHAINEQSLKESERIALLGNLSDQVEEWYDGLPPGLIYNEGNLATLDLVGYGLHTQYCKVQILIRQALAQTIQKSERRTSQITQDNVSQALVMDDSKAMIYNYALRIARLVVTYRETFGVERIPSIMLDNAVLAATTMIRYAEAVRGPTNLNQHESWLRHLTKSMQTVQPHFPIVARMIDYLSRISGKDTQFFPEHALQDSRATTQGPCYASFGTSNLDGDTNHIVDHYAERTDTTDRSFGGDNIHSMIWGYNDPNIGSSMFSFGGFSFDLAPCDSLIQGLAPS